MLTYYNEERFSIGQLAEIYNISPRTLRLYHEMGLLVPQYIDVQTGYRYYSRSQFPRLEMIIQMKSVGLSLKRIMLMLNTRDLSMFEALLSEQIDELDDKIMEYTISRNSLYRQLTSCKHLRNPPNQDTIFIEFIPKRRALMFEIETYDFQKDYPEGSPWREALDNIKATLKEKNIPLTYFNQVGCTIPQEFLQQGRFLCNGAFIMVMEDYAESPCTVMQSGTYLCSYRRYIAMDNRSESVGLQKMLDYIKENGYQIVGPYLGEVIAEASIFDYADHNILVKLQIPIKVRND